MRISRDRAARRRLAALGAIAAIAAVVGIAVGAGAGGGSGEGAREEGGAQRAAKPPLPLEEAVGQLLVMSFDGPAAPDYILRRLRSGEGAGVILFARNMPDAATTVALTEEIQRAAGGGALVMTDQEGGDIRTLLFAGPEVSQGAQATPEDAKAAAEEAAAGLAEAGVNVNLAPVADVVTSGGVFAGRAYPGDEAAVGAAAAAAIEAHERGGVGTTAKHFPGLGRATANTDDEPVSIDVAREDLERDDLPAFAAAIEAGVPLVMTSHALYPAWDAERIASQSPEIVEGVLRRELGFRGVVVTDSIEAQAVLDRSGIATAAERSIEAGNDLVLMTGSNSWNEVYPALLARARTDRAFERRVRESAGRVLQLKKRLGL